MQRMYFYIVMMLAALGHPERKVFSIIEIEESDADDASYIQGLISAMGPGLVEASEAQRVKLMVNPELDGCLWATKENLKPLEGGVLLYKRGPKGSKCTFQDKVEEATSLGASAVLVANYRDTVFNMAGNGTYVAKIPSVMITNTGAEELVEASRTKQVWIKMWGYKLQLFDESMPIIGLLAVFCVWLGAEANYAANKERENGAGRGSIGPIGGDVVSPQMNDAVGFVIMAAGMLSFLYFAINYVIYILLIGFAFSGATAMSHFMELFLNRYCGMHGKTAKYISFILAGAVGAVWFIWRFAHWSWIPQNILCIALLVNVQMAIKMDSLKVAATLLSLAFFYDIFMVFITPYFTKGTSVMETVALGGDSGEVLPMLLAIPKFRNPFRQMARLGLGDVALPGTLVSYCKRVDPNGSLTGYYWVSIIGYSIGLAITFAALVLMRLSQPALLWLVPSMLLPVMGLSCYRGEFGALWRGDLKLGYRLLNKDDEAASV